MSPKIKLPPEARRGTHMPSGKNWRLVTPSRRKGLKASLMTTFTSHGERYAVFRVF
jgi:hypothetical protein